MSEVSFPPTTVVPASARIQELLTCMFVGLRKAATEKYKTQDGLPLLQYHQTLSDRDMVRNTILEYEITHGMVLDDRPQNGAAAMSNGNGASVPPGTQLQQSVMTLQTNPQPQMGPVSASPAQAAQVALQHPVPATPGPQEMPTGLPTGKVRRAAPKLSSGVAPPPVPVTTYSSPPPPPDGAMVLKPVEPAPVMQAAPVALAAPISLSVPQGVVPVSLTAPAAPNFGPPPVQQQQAAPQQSADLDKLLSKMEELIKSFQSAKQVQDSEKNDFKTVISNLSGQMNETNKKLGELKSEQDLIMVALHWLFLCSPAAKSAEGKANDIISFKKYVAQYLPQ